MLLIFCDCKGWFSIAMLDYIVCQRLCHHTWSRSYTFHFCQHLRHFHRNVWEAGTPPSEIVPLLAKQLCSAVLWEPSVRLMMKAFQRAIILMRPKNKIKGDNVAGVLMMNTFQRNIFAHTNLINHIISTTKNQPTFHDAFAWFLSRMASQNSTKWDPWNSSRLRKSWQIW